MEQEAGADGPEHALQDAAGGQLCARGLAPGQHPDSLQGAHLFVQGARKVLRARGGGAEPAHRDAGHGHVDLADQPGPEEPLLLLRGDQRPRWVQHCRDVAADGHHPAVSDQAAVRGGDCRALQQLPAPHAQVRRPPAGRRVHGLAPRHFPQAPRRHEIGAVRRHRHGLHDGGLGHPAGPRPQGHENDQELHRLQHPANP
mmetsp:Transcript_25114/g.53853  ORF Transcript_25114/g.53853 Transcript_25114/m.53853 type:complete len:200 (+) Transcript_25114:894-1493(+)